MTLRPLTDAALLHVWERGRALGPAERAVLAIAAAFPGISTETARSWPLGRRDARLLELYDAHFGRRLPARTQCPYCHAELEFELDVGALKPTHEPDPAGPLDTEVDGFTVRMRAPNSADLAALEGSATEAEAASRLWSRCIQVTDAAGDGVASHTLSEVQRARIESLLESLDPHSDCVLQLVCDSCGQPWTAPYDVASAVWLNIAQLATHLLHQVHRLARAYGWTESEILALGRRRELYLSFLE